MLINSALLCNNEYMKDYKSFVPGKYPEPEDRMRKVTFPSEDELFTYGDDFPMPESMEDLRCEYKEDERFPLVLADLEGYKVPPLGLTCVSASGSGHKHGIIYTPGVLREDKTRFGKEFGMTSADAVTIREDKKAAEIVAGIRRSFDKQGVVLYGHSTPEILGAMAEVVMDKVFDEPSAREARMFLKDMTELLIAKEEGAKKKESALTIEEARALLKITEQAMANKQGEVIDVEFVDEGEGEE